MSETLREARAHLRAASELASAAEEARVAFTAALGTDHEDEARGTYWTAMDARDTASRGLRTRAPRLLAALCDEVEALERRAS